MGKKGASKTNNNKKKNKGPKGKKARAKAKLVRQWGETPAIDDQHQRQATIRRGKREVAAAAIANNTTNKSSASTTTWKQQQQQQQPQLEDEQKNIVDESDDDDDNDENAVATFLETLQSKAVERQNHVGHNDDDDDMMSEEDGVVEMESENDDNASMSDEGGEVQQAPVVDLFTERFSRPPLPEDAEALSQLMAKVQKQVTFTLALGGGGGGGSSSTRRRSSVTSNTKRTSQIELKVPSQWLQQRNLLLPTTTDNNDDDDSIGPRIMDPKQWQAQAKAAFACNRQFLKDQWNNTTLRLGEKQRRKRIRNIQNDKPTTLSLSSFDSEFQTVAYPLLASYVDVLFATHCDEEQHFLHHKKQQKPTHQQPHQHHRPLSKHHFSRTSLSRIIGLHILNHIWTSQIRIQKHNKRIQQQDEQDKDVGTEKESDLDNNDDDQDKDTNKDVDVNRDQGFTRPTILILFPTRGICFDFVQILKKMLSGGGDDDDDSNNGGNTTIANWGRFELEYGPPPPVDDGTGNDQEQQDREKLQRRQEVLEQKGPEWLELFGDDVNDDDDFRLGMAIQNVQAPRKNKKKKKQSTSIDNNTGNSNNHDGSAATLKLFTDFYKSDVILASPLGLKMACTKKSSSQEDDDGEVEDDADGGANSNGVDAGFLSSIEICVLMRSNVMLMQNWDHVNDVLKWVNHGPPRQTRYTDFSRVRNYFLQPYPPVVGQAQYWRQVIIDAQDFYDPLIASTFRRFATSWAGRAVFRPPPTTAAQASIHRVVTNVRQVFQRVPSCTSLLNQGKDKLEYFAQHILPELRQRSHSLVFIPSYFDFVAVRNLLLKREVDFVSVTEYARTSEVSRGRARFLQGRKPIMLYTGRAHFFYRHTIRGVRHLLFYSVPEHAQFYTDHVNGLSRNNKRSQDDSAALEDAVLSCLVLFTKYDSHALERIVGNDNCRRMVSGEKLTFFFDP